MSTSSVYRLKDGRAGAFKPQPRCHWMERAGGSYRAAAMQNPSPATKRF